ncbi:unnamed protein product [Durusdinium trenchii]|uniref:non-specific serine/threonine protein kinase n=1 Tax=Durusdinium trenchii TaxID=1381693 RepID=A0ABP0HLP2_9DINO
MELACIDDDCRDMRRDMRKELEEWRAAKGRTRGKENVPAPSSPCSPATPLTPRTPRQLPRELKKAHVLEFPRELSSREPRIGLSPTPLGERFATPPRHHAPPPAPALGAPVPRDPALGAAVVPAAPPPSPREAKRNAGLEGGRKFAEVVGKALHVYPRSNAWRFLGRQVSVWFVLTRWDLAGFHCTLPPSVLLAAVVAAFEEENKAQILEEAVAMATEEKQLRTEEEELHDEHVALLDRLSRLQAEALSSGEEQATLRERFEEATRELQATAKTVGRGGVKHQDHLSRAQDIFTFWFYEVRDRARCALPRFRRSEVLPILGVVLDVFWAPVLEVGWRWTYGWKDFEFGEQLGRGSFGVVFKVLRKEDAVTCVCKQIQLSEMKKKARLEANQEVELLRKVSRGCSYIVQYLGSFLEGETLHIIMEFCEKGDLSQFLKSRHSGLEERSVWRYLLQIALGLQWLHQNRILHRDIKTLNVFLKTNDDVRLGDLGVARVLSGSNFANTFVGTPYYLSPEICEEKPYNELSDVWAFGCVVYEMCTLRHPFEAKNQAALLIKILRGQFAPIETRYTEDLRELIDGCMQRELGKRTKLNDLLAGAAAQSWASRVEIAMQEPTKVLHRRPEKRLSPPTASGRATPQIPKAAAPRSRVRQDPRQNRRVEDAKVTLVAPKAKSDPRTLAPKDSARSKEDEARVLHAAEVAELPDVVMVAPRPSRNVVTVEQLLSKDNSPIKRLLQRNGGSMTQAALQDIQEEEVTLRPGFPAFPTQEDVEAEIAEEIEEGADHEGDDAELTARSAFEDSLMYTSSTLAASRIGPEHEQEDHPDEPEMTTEIDGLLCDTWRTLKLEDEAVHQADEAFSTVAEAVEAAEAEVEEKISEELQEDTPAPAPTGAPPSAPLAHEPSPDAQVARLTAQIQRLYADVVRDLDRPARKVWDELYALFQAAFRDAWERGSSPGALALSSSGRSTRQAQTAEAARSSGLWSFQGLQMEIDSDFRDALNYYGTFTKDAKNGYGTLAAGPPGIAPNRSVYFFSTSTLRLEPADRNEDTDSPNWTPPPRYLSFFAPLLNALDQMVPHVMKYLAGDALAATIIGSLAAAGSTSGACDLATQIHYWTEFRKAMKDYTPHVDLKAKRFLPPVLAEWFAGLPQNWTSPTATVTKESFNDLFKPLQVEADSFCAQIIQKRMAEGFLPPGEVHENVVTFNPSPKVRESVTGIELGSKRRGFLQSYNRGNQRKLASLQEFKKRGMEVRWATVVGRNVGVNGAVLDGADAFTRRCSEPWNSRQRPPLTEWLSADLTKEDENRLHALGNIVFPSFGHFAINVIEESIRGETGTQRSLSRSRSPNRQVAARMLRQKTLILGDSEDDKSDFDDSQAPP